MWYLLWVQRRIFLGPVDEPANRGLIDLDRIERGILLAMTIPIVFIGVYPNPLLRRIEPAMLELLHQMESRSVVVGAPATDEAQAAIDDANLRPRASGERQASAAPTDSSIVAFGARDGS